MIKMLYYIRFSGGAFHEVSSHYMAGHPCITDHHRSSDRDGGAISVLADHTLALDCGPQRNEDDFRCIFSNQSFLRTHPGKIKKKFDFCKIGVTLGVSF